MFSCPICKTKKKKFIAAKNDVMCYDCFGFAKRACKCFGVNICTEKSLIAIEKAMPSEITIKKSELLSWQKSKKKHLYAKSFLDILLVCKMCSQECKNKYELFSHCSDNNGHIKYTLEFFNKEWPKINVSHASQLCTVMAN